MKELEARMYRNTLQYLKLSNLAFASCKHQIFHNYIREHEGLKGKTPAEACGIAVKGKNKWFTLIQNSSKKDDEACTP